MIKTSSTFLLVILFQFLNLYGQTAIISGKCEGCNNSKILFYSLSDPVSRKLIPLRAVSCNRDDEFYAEIPVKDTAFISFRYGCCRFDLIVREGKNYVVNIPSNACNEGNCDNSRFDNNNSMIPEVLNDSLDINNLIRIFDAEFNPVFNQVAERIEKRAGKEKIPQLLEYINKITGLSENAFFKDFVKYRLVMLNVVAYGEHTGKVQDSVIINCKFNPLNPAYTDLAEQLYSRTFRVLLSGNAGEKLTRAIEKSSPSLIMELLSQYSGISNPLLQQYVILMNTFYGYYEGYIKTENATGIFDLLQTEGRSEYIRNLAAVLKERIVEFTPGTFPPSFSLPDSTGKLISIMELKGKFTLIIFIKSADFYTTGELSILSSWANRFSGRLNVVAVITGRNFNEICSQFKRFSNSWLFLNASDSPFISDIYDLKIFPSFFLLDTEGKIAIRYCPPPSENLEGLIAKLLK